MRPLILLLAPALAACQPAAPEPAITPDASAALMPADARLADLYRQSCRRCHTSTDTGAPLAGDRAAWDARYAKGEGALVDSTIGGYKGMPAGGQCFACTPDDYRALIRFMAGKDQ